MERSNDLLRKNKWAFQKEKWDKIVCNNICLYRDMWSSLFFRVRKVTLKKRFTLFNWLFGISVFTPKRD